MKSEAGADALDKVRERFDLDAARVDNLVSIFKTLSQNPKRLPSENTDVLRSAVVMLHASLEDALRSLLAWKLPDAKPEHLKGIYFDQTERNDKINVSQLRKHKGKS